jgi:catalase
VKARISSKRRRSSLVLGYAIVAISLGSLIGSFAWVASWTHWPRLRQTLTSQQLIDAFEANTHRYPGFRRNHTKGICVSGHFKSNGNAVALSRASVFKPSLVPVTGRLSAPGSDPAQNDANTPVRSFALRFTTADGRQWRTATNSAPMFAVRIPQALYQQLIALRPAPGTGLPDPAKMDEFLKKHPETRAFYEWLAHHPASSAFYNASYFSINAFRFINATGAIRFVRWRVVPDTPYQPVSSSEARDPDFLAHDLTTRLERGSVRWHLMITPAAPGDPTDDATRVWPRERESHRIDAGLIVIDQAEAQIDGACRDINFDPLILPAGTEPSDDPLFAVRSAAYAVSFDRRTREEALPGSASR